MRIRAILPGRILAVITVLALVSAACTTGATTGSMSGYGMENISEVISRMAA